MLRADDSMLLVLQLHDHEPAPLFALQRASEGLFDRITERFNVLWEEATQRVEAATMIAAPPTAQKTALDGPQARRWPRRPTA